MFDIMDAHDMVNFAFHLLEAWLYCRFFPFHAAFASWLHLEPCFLWKTLYSVWCLPLVIWPEIFEKWQIYIQMYFWRPLQSQEARREVPASDYSLVKTVRWYRSVMDIDLYQYKLRFICWANVWWFYIFQICKAFWGEKVNVLRDLSVSHCMSFEGC